MLMESSIYNNRFFQTQILWHALCSYSFKLMRFGGLALRLQNKDIPEKILREKSQSFSMKIGRNNFLSKNCISDIGLMK
jgi:hypothetical protein